MYIKKQAQTKSDYFRNLSENSFCRKMLSVLFCCVIFFNCQVTFASNKADNTNPFTQLKTAKDIDGKDVIRFANYDAVISALEANKSKESFYKSAAKTFTESVWKLANSPVKLELDPIQDYDSKYSERFFVLLLASLRNKTKKNGLPYKDWSNKYNRKKSHNKASYKECPPFYYLYSQVMLELLATQAKSVYYEPRIGRKKAALKRARQTFNNLGDIIKREEKTKNDGSLSYMYVSDYVVGNAYLLASELTTDNFYKPILTSRATNFIAQYTMGESTVLKLKQNLISKSFDSIKAKAQILLESAPDKKSKELGMDDYIEQALIADITYMFGHIIDDEKARQLGDKWKLYNNSTEYFQSSLDSHLRATKQGIDTGWNSEKIVESSLKATAYALENIISTATGKYVLMGQKTFDQVSKISGWASLGVIMKIESRDALPKNNEGVDSKLYVDGKFKGRIFQNAQPFM